MVTFKDWAAFIRLSRRQYQKICNLAWKRSRLKWHGECPHRVGRNLIVRLYPEQDRGVEERGRILCHECGESSKHKELGGIIVRKLMEERLSLIHI
eukprot:1546359-Pyramimonas_sp.AAC.2